MALTEQQKQQIAEQLAEKRRSMGEVAFKSYVSKIEAEIPKRGARQAQQAQAPVVPVNQNVGTGFDPSFERVEGEGLGMSALKTLGNVPKSAFQLGQDVVSAVTNPVQTGKSIVSLLKGVGGKIGETVTENTQIGQQFLEFANQSRQARGLPALQKDTEGRLQGAETPEIQVANAVGQYFNERYGSVENFKESVVEDPVGVLSDIASVISGGGAIIKQAGNTSKVSRTSQFTPISTSAFTPRSIAQTPNNLLTRTGTSLTEIGNKLEPTTAVTRGVSNVVGAAANTLPGRIVSEAAPTPGRFAEGEIVKALELTQGDVRRISEKTGNDVADFVTRNSLLKETPEEIANAVDVLKNNRYTEVRTEIGKVPNVYGKDSVPQVPKALQSVRGVVEDVPGLEDVASEINRLIAQDSYTLSDVQRVKEILDNNTNIFTRSGDVKGAATAQGLGNIRQDLRLFIENEVSKATNGQTNIRELNNDVATARELVDAIEMRETRDLTRNYSPLTSTLLGGAAFAGTGDIYVALGVAGLSKVAQTPSFRIALARLLKSTPVKDLSKWSEEVAKGNLSPQTRQSLAQLIEEARKNAEFIESGSQVVSEIESQGQ